MEQQPPQQPKPPRRAPAPKAAAPMDPLDAAAADPLRALALILWQDRMRNPDLYRQITENDIQGLDDCTRYLKVKPRVVIERPQGLPAQEAIPAQGNRRAVPARAATPPKPFVIVKLVDEKGDAIRPVENNQEDYDAAQAAGQVAKARSDASMLANQLINQARTGEYSLAIMQEAANALLILSRA